MPSDPRSIVAEWVDQYGRLLYAYAYRWTNSSSDADDIVQSVFVRSVDHFQRVQEAESVRAYLLTMTRNESIRYLKQKSHTSEVIQEIVEEKEARQESFERSEWIACALKKLGAAHREILLMYYFEDLGYKEIAELLQLPIGTVMSRLSRAKETLKEFLTGERPGKALQGNPTP